MWKKINNNNNNNIINTQLKIPFRQMKCQNTHTHKYVYTLNFNRAKSTDKQQWKIVLDTLPYCQK